MKLKRVIGFVLILMVMFSLTACGNVQGSSNETDTEVESSEVEYEVTQLPEETPKVYMTTDISPEGLMAVYEAMGWTPEGKVAVKLSTGDPPAGID